MDNIKSSALTGTGIGAGAGLLAAGVKLSRSGERDALKAAKVSMKYMTNATAAISSGILPELASSKQLEDVFESATKSMDKFGRLDKKTYKDFTKAIKGATKDLDKTLKEKFKGVDGKELKSKFDSAKANFKKSEIVKAVNNATKKGIKPMFKKAAKYTAGFAAAGLALGAAIGFIKNKQIQTEEQ